MYCSLGISLISLWQDRRLYSANNIKCSLSFFRFILFYFIFFNKKVLKSNKKIDNLIQKMHLKINSKNDIVFEWIPYNQFDNIEEISKGDFATIYSATWKNGPLYYDDYYKVYIRKSDKKISLKCLHNSQNITNEFLDEV